MKIKTLVERVQAIRSSSPDQVIKQRVAAAAESISRAGDMQLRVELANEALAALAVLLYERDIDGQFANIDPKTWRLLVPAPWGNRGWKMWEMRQWESRILRRILIERAGAGGRPVLFDYNSDAQSWHLNLGDYKTLDQALFWVEHSAIKLSEWRRFVELTRAGTRERMARLSAQERS